MNTDFTVSATGGRVVTVSGPSTATFSIAPPEAIVVKDEEHDSLPPIGKSPWRSGVRLKNGITQETTARGILESNSVVVRNAADPATIYIQDADYCVHPEYATVWRAAESAIPENAAVCISYTVQWPRLDSIIRDSAGALVLREGKAHPATPELPACKEGEERVANILVPAWSEGIADSELFPVLEAACPDKPLRWEEAIKLIPAALRKLQNGEHLRILAWGDSVTHGDYLAPEEHDGPKHWQEQFVARLRERFPQATIELSTMAWGGRQSQSFVADKNGEHCYEKYVAGAEVDLVISEFVNDAGYDEEKVNSCYGSYLADFRKTGKEWVIHTPHYVCTSWMDLRGQKYCDEDPRAYVAALRIFTRRNGIALSDASRRWGRLWRQGIPYETLLSNCINHPNVAGLGIYADALMELFPEPRQL